MDRNQDSLIHACHFISEQEQLAFVFPNEMQALPDLEEKLQAICHASHLRGRSVCLPTEWWHDDHGSLIGFLGPEQKPVALLWKNGYRVIDPDSDRAVNGDLGRLISVQAFMFYTPFKPDLNTGRDLIRLALKNHIEQWKLVVPAGLLGAFYALFPPIATKLAFEYAIPENDIDLTIYLFFGMLFSSLGFALFYSVRSVFFLRLKGLGSHFVQSATWDRLLNIPLPFFHRFSIGHFSSALFCLNRIQNLVTIRAFNLIFSGFFSFLYLALMIYFSPLLSLFAGAAALLSLSLSCVCSFYKVTLLRKRPSLQSLVLTAIRGIEKLRAGRAEETFFSKWSALFSKKHRDQATIQHLETAATVANATVPLLSFFFIYAAMFFSMEVKQISLSDFLAFSVAFGGFAFAIYPFGDTIVYLSEVIPLWEQAKSLIKEPQEEQKTTAQRLQGEIKLEKVSTMPLLNNLSLHIQPGEFIGITGRKGSGKSTLLRLLLGLEKPQSGALFFDGKNLSTLDLSAHRKQIGFSSRDTGITTGTLFDFLTTGILHTQEEIERALELSECNKDLAQLPMKLSTLIHTLSGGQKQRLSLARAFLGHPPILLFDEATSELDSQSQHQILTRIEQLNTTRLLVTTRLANLKKANRIYVLDKGSIIQTGTFDELAKIPGYFADTLEKQRL